VYNVSEHVPENDNRYIAHIIKIHNVHLWWIILQHYRDILRIVRSILPGWVNL